MTVADTCLVLQTPSSVIILWQLSKLRSAPRDQRRHPDCGCFHAVLIILFGSPTVCAPTEKAFETHLAPELLSPNDLESPRKRGPVQPSSALRDPFSACTAQSAQAEEASLQGPGLLASRGDLGASDSGWSPSRCSSCRPPKTQTRRK